MTKSELIDELATKKGIPLKTAERVVKEIFDSMTKILISDGRIEIRGFGSFNNRRYDGYTGGVVTIFVPHTTAGITINENADPDVAKDMESFSDELVPRSNRFRHSEGNSDAHIKASFYGSSVQVIVRNGKLWLGTWQGIYFCEFDGPRERKVYLAFTG